jgi:hypothetical protein
MAINKDLNVFTREMLKREFENFAGKSFIWIFNFPFFGSWKFMTHLKWLKGIFENEAIEILEISAENFN